MKLFARLAVLALACAGPIATAAPSGAEPTEPDLGSCHRVYATPPGGGEPVEVEACP